MPKRIKTAYVGVYYRTVRRIGGKGEEKMYYITFKKDGKLIEEKVGAQFRNAITPARAARIRGERIENKRLSPAEIRKQAEAKRWTFDNLWTEYVDSKKKVNHADKSRFLNYISPTIGNKEPSGLTPDDIKNLKKTVTRLAEGTLYNLLSLIIRLAKFGVNGQKCSGLTFRIDRPKKLNNEKTETLTNEELKRLLNVLRDDQSDISDAMLMALYTGMRKMEILGLKWSDINFETGFILIRDPKSGMDQRIPLNDQARDLLEGRARTGDYVFTGPHGAYSREVYHHANRLKEAAGLPEDFRPFHGLRHVFASLLASSGQVDLYVLQKLLTHANPKQTQRYAHLRDEALKNGSNVMTHILSNIGG